MNFSQPCWGAQVCWQVHLYALAAAHQVGNRVPPAYKSAILCLAPALAAASTASAWPSLPAVERSRFAIPSGHNWDPLDVTGPILRLGQWACWRAENAHRGCACPALPSPGEPSAAEPSQRAGQRERKAEFQVGRCSGNAATAGTGLGRMMATALPAGRLVLLPPPAPGSRGSQARARPLTLVHCNPLLKCSLPFSISSGA